MNDSDVDDETTGFEEDEDVDGDIKEPFNPKDIDVTVQRITLDALLKRLKNKELKLTPDFQRRSNLWKEENKSRLIESILLRIPLPSFYFSEDEDGNYTVVDGLQRLCSIFHFWDAPALNKATSAKLSPLRLKGLEYLVDLEGLSFHDLDRKHQRRIEELEITVNLIRASTPEVVKFNVFSRLNQGGMPLKAQEIRNAIFNGGQWRTRVRDMAESSTFRTATEKKIPTDRQQDIELVLRYVALISLNSRAIAPKCHD